MGRHLSNQPNRNEKCRCGSGRKYKKCCGNPAQLAETFKRHLRLRQWNTSATLRQTTLEFIDDLSSTLGLHISDNTVTGPFASQVPLEAIAEIHSRITRYFPRSAGTYKRLLVDVEQQGGVGVYLGPRSPHSICTHIARHSIYSQKIWVPNPFCQLYADPEGGNVPNAQESPLDWKNFTIRNALLLLKLRPWIESGVVACAPALGWADEEFLREKVSPVSGLRMSQESPDLHKAHTFDVISEAVQQVHPNVVPSLIRELITGDIPPELMDEIVKMTATNNQFNTFDDTRGPRKTVISFGDGETLETAEIIARLTGGYTLPTGFRHEKEHRTKPIDTSSPQTNISLALSGYQFNFLNHATLNFALKIRTDGRLNRLRSYLDRLWRRQPQDWAATSDDQIRLFQEELGEEYRKYKEEWGLVEKKLWAHIGASGAGGIVAGNAGHLSTGSFAIGTILGAGTFFTTMLSHALSSRFDRKNIRENALSIFVDLDRVRP